MRSIAQILSDSKTIAIVGLSNKPAAPPGAAGFLIGKSLSKAARFALDRFAFA